MKKDKKIAVLLFSLIGLISVSVGLTVSFYASGQDLGFQDFNVSLASDPTLEIGIENDSGEVIYYQNEVPSEALKKYVVTEFEPVSMMYSSIFLNGESENPIFRKRYERINIEDETTFKESKVAIGGYFSIPIYLRSDSDIYVSFSEDTYIKEDEEANKAKIDTLRSKYPSRNDEEILAGLNNIKKSMRIGLFDSEKRKNYIIDPYKEEETAFFGNLDLNSDRFYDSYFESEKEKEILFGEYENEDKLVYELVSEENNLPLADLNAFNANHRKDSYKINFEQSIQNGFIGSYENSLKLEDVTTDDEFIVLNHDIPHRFVLSLYIEGWDKDNISISEYGAFLSLIKFKVTKEYIL